MGGSRIDPHPLKRYCSNSCRLKARYERVTKAVPPGTAPGSVPEPRRRSMPIGAPKIVGADTTMPGPNKAQQPSVRVEEVGLTEPADLPK
jgi:hypothetical protein